MPATQRGIYHNLRESKYTISNGEIVFFFSSMVYLNKFMNGYKDNRLKVRENMLRMSRANFPLNFDTLADVFYYQRVEKRGFFVRLKRARITYDDLYKYSIRKMNENETLEWGVHHG